ncbi:peptide/nickel transport system ATP-binding protein [Roseivivax halotolerans]|uniref:Peptide/nickel transport system ATP-binding protein n=1 Tax=Roseivivax halotolerans TaxID=93684 RepID=A0A1I6AL91_9RHOB|nr:ABC transporter ATP-binding protein [Roseivivax halotolerans]SFQ69439.1 peptide/nickel transport system ATP-binding protein [Roseivivax halotolerans]
MTETVLTVRDLSVQVATPSGAKTVLDGLSFELRAGETLCLAGESGSGKSMTALAIMGLLPKPMCRITRGSVCLGDTQLVGLPDAAYRKIRTARVAMIFQEPMTSLNPLMTVQQQLTETLLEHDACTRAEAPARALQLLRDVQLTEPERRLKQYPHELSGGMRQRVMIAIALACDPEVLIADEPTTALDVTVQAEILDLIRALQRDHGTSVLMITHDMGVVAEMADHVIILRHGQEVESAPVRDIFSTPRSEYAKELLGAVPRLGTAPPRPAKPQGVPVLEVDDLSVRFDVRGGVLNRVQARVHAVEGVSFGINAGETLALVGESGCGKSTIGKALMGLVPWQGSVQVMGRQTRGMGPALMKPVRRDVQMVFQDPGASLDSRMTVGDQVAEPLLIHGLASGSALKDRVEHLFRRVGLSPDMMARYPHEFSGGQRQRVNIARALSLSPKLIIADESVSALDVSVQAQVLELLQEIQDEDGLAFLFISHDMAVVEQVADRIMVMRLGQVVEEGARDAILRDPRHQYTRRLLSAVPVPDPSRQRPERIETESIGSPIWPKGREPDRLKLEEISFQHRVAV